MDKCIYMDNAATTSLLPEVLDAMMPYLTDNYGNPSAMYSIGRESRRAVEHAREQVSDVIGAKPNEIIFTSCGTEADNMAIRVANHIKHNGNGIITDNIEHKAILETVKHLDFDAPVIHLPVKEDGIIDPTDIEKAIAEDIALISIMHANNEIGTIQDIKEIGMIALGHSVVFHVDAVQTFGHIPIDVNEMQIDLLSASAHKLHGPKGVGMLYVRNGIDMPSFIHGGHQEDGLRAGTENVAGIVGFGKAAELAKKSMYNNMSYITNLRNYMRERLLTEIDGCTLNGSRTSVLPGHINISFDGIRGEQALAMLDQFGICASSGSACTSGSGQPSHVLKAIGLTDKDARSSIRFTLSEENTMEEVDYVLSRMKIVVDFLRKNN